MRRFWRLLTPSVAFAIVAALSLISYGDSWSQLRGGLVVRGFYTLALQLVISAVIVVSIDDLKASRVRMSLQRHAHPGSMVEISTRVVGYRRALLSFHGYPFVSTSLLAFGAGVSVATVLIGAFPADHSTSYFVAPSEIPFGCLMVLSGVVFLVRAGVAGFLGCATGLWASVICAQVIYNEGKLRDTLLGWGAILAAFYVVALLKVAVPRVGRPRPRATH